MTKEDLNKFIEALEVTRKIVPTSDIAFHSPSRTQIAIVRDVFRVHPTKISESQWDLVNSSLYKTDLLCISNVFMYITETEKAINNALDSCRYLLLQDIIRRDRGDNCTLGTDGDCMRHSYGIIKSNYPNAFDINVFKDKIIFFTPYIDNGSSLHFITLIKGNL